MLGHLELPVFLRRRSAPAPGCPHAPPGRDEPSARGWARRRRGRSSWSRWSGPSSSSAPAGISSASATP